jgi:hypothetical protein
MDMWANVNLAPAKLWGGADKMVGLKRGQAVFPDLLSYHGCPLTYSGIPWSLNVSMGSK